MKQKAGVETLKAASMAPVVLVLTLNRQKMCERVLVGEEHQIRSRLEGRPDARVLYDEEQPLGTFLCSHESQLKQDWEAGAVRNLKEALYSVIGRKERELSAWEFISKKQNYHDSVRIFVAHQCCYYYVRNRTPLGTGKSAEMFEEQMRRLTGSFQQKLWDGEKSCSAGELLDRVEQLLPSSGSWEDTQAQIWYPAGSRGMECLVVRESLWPAVLYSLTHLQEWGWSFCRCRVCGRMFAASSKHYGLCSDECHQVKNRQNKRDYDERARTNQYDLEYKNSSQRMRNRLNSLKRRNVPEEEWEAAEDFFVQFRKEALKRKKEIRTDEDCGAFLLWMREQEGRFELFCQG